MSSGLSKLEKKKNMLILQIKVQNLQTKILNFTKKFKIQRKKYKQKNN